MTGDLVTLSQVQTAYPKLTSVQLADVPQLISSVSAEVSRRYPGVALRASYDETHDPGESRTVTLGHRPVLRVARVRAGMARVLTLTYSGAGRRAGAEVVSTGEADAPAVASVNLAVELSGVAQAPVVLDAATYPTLADVATHANGLGDWSAAVAPGCETMATTDLEVQGPKSAAGGTGAALWAYTRDLHDFDVTDRTTGELLLYEWHPASFRHPDRRWGTDPRVTAVRVQYEAGRIATPADVVRAVLMIVGAELQDTAYSGSVTYEMGGGYAYRVSNPTYRLPGDAERILSRYKARRVV